MHLSAGYQTNLISLHVTRHTSLCRLPDTFELSARYQTCISLQVTRHTSLCTLPDTHHYACYQTNLISLHVTKHASLCRLPHTSLHITRHTSLHVTRHTFTQAHTQHVQSVSRIWLGRVGFFVGINGQKNDRIGIKFKKLRLPKLSYKASCN